MNLNKKSIVKANSALTILIVIGILAVINFFSYQLFYRFDLTQNKDYSISKASKEMVKGLDDIVNIKVYFSKNLPTQYINLPQEVGDLLDEYANYSGGKIKTEFIDPASDTEFKQKLMVMGIPELQFNVLEKDKYQVVNGYLGMAIQYGDKTEAIPVVEDTRNLEYQITLAIKKVTDKEKAVVGYVTDSGTLKPESEITFAYKKLNEMYEVRQINLTIEEEIPAEVRTLIIVGPKEKFEEKALKEIDKFLMQGGSLLVLQDGVKVGEGLIASENETGLEAVLEKYGVKLNHNLVLDLSSGIASFNQGFVTFSTNYPFWPKVIKSGFDKDSTAVAKLESVTMPWPSSLEILSDKVGAGNKVSYLAKTTANSWTQESNFDLSPQQSFTFANKGEKTLAVSVFGKFQSAYGGGSTDSGRLIVAGDSDFLSDGFARQAPDNIILFQNLVDSLSLDEDLISIRSKGISERPIKQKEDGEKAIIRYSNIFGLTLVVVAFGLIRYFLRRRTRFEDEI